MHYMIFPCGGHYQFHGSPPRVGDRISMTQRIDTTDLVGTEDGMIYAKGEELAVTHVKWAWRPGNSPQANVYLEESQ